MINRGFQQYSKAQAETAPPEDLVIMLYNGAIRFLNRAKVDLDSHNLEGVHKNLVKAQDIVSELMITLDMDTGEIAHNLFRLYEYMHYRLVESNCKKESEGIDEVLGLLHDLLPAWEEAVRLTKQNKTKTATAMGSLQFA